MSEPETGGRNNVLQHSLRAFLIPTILFGLGYGLISGEYIVTFVVSLTIGLTLAAIFTLHWHLLQPRLEHLPRERRLTLEIVFGCVETILGAALAFLICVRVYRFDIPAFSLGSSIILVFGLVLVVRSVRYAGEFYRDLRKKELLEEQLRALTAEAELKALKAQINPHFLFNTLNTITQLIHTDSDLAEETVERLAEMFRYSLNGSEQQRASLADELSFVDVYLEIEQARFGEKLQVTREIAPDVLTVPIPSLILQPLVENAVKHGQGGDGNIIMTIRAIRQDETLAISIADQGPGMPPRFQIGESSGHGMRNVDERLRKMYGEEYGLIITANEPRGSVVTFKIPLGGCEVNQCEY